MNPNTDAEAERIIDALGGTSKAGKFLGISKSAVSQWRRNGVPKSQLKYLRLAKPSLFDASSAPHPQPTGELS